MDARHMRRIALGLALCLALTGCRRAPEPPEPDPPPLPTYSATGRDNPNVPKSAYDEDSFVSVGGFTMYTAANAASHIGVDVSSHQGEIDWAQVAQTGVEFAMLRAGFRGYGEGGIFQDDRFLDNIQGALDAGIAVGIYFFSQAVSAEEAVEEARTVLEWIAPYEIAYPVVFDWETIPQVDARSNDVAPETVTDCVKAFCAEVEEAGYVPMVYFNRSHVYDVIDLEQLSGIGFWLAGYRETPAFEYDFQIWQYSCTGTVPGIATDVDLDICLVDYPAPAEEGPPPDGPDSSE